MFELHTVNSLPVIFPEREIFFRLGGNSGKTVLPGEVKNQYRKTALQAYELCRPCGRWCVVDADVRSDGIMLDNGTFFVPGGDFARRCQGAAQIWCAAVTVGADVLNLRDTQERISVGAVCDAVASECADAAMDLLQKQAAAILRPRGLSLAERRYSPGYGDMPLTVQRFFYELLDLGSLGMKLTENNFFIPEKSVTAFAGVTEEM